MKHILNCKIVVLRQKNSMLVLRHDGEIEVQKRVRIGMKNIRFLHM